MIPFNLPTLVGDELDFITQALNCRKLSGDGAFTRQCHAWLEKRLGVKKALLTHPVRPRSRWRRFCATSGPAMK